MNKKLLYTIASMLAVLTLSTSANALKVDLQLDQSINQKFSFKYDIYDANAPKNQQHQMLNAEGIDVSVMPQFMASMNIALEKMTPVSPSSFTLGYSNNGEASIYPASCSNIPAEMITTIRMSVDGCVVSH